MIPLRETSSILIVDDNPAVRTGLRTLLELSAGITRFAEAGCFEEALQKMRQSKPALVLLDLHLDQKNTDELQGLDLLAQIKRESPDTQVFVLTVDSSETT